MQQLMDRGLVVGDHSYILDRQSIDWDNCHLVSIGNWVTVAPGALILAHDAAPELFTGFCKLSATHIHDYVFIGAKAVILPGVSIGPRAIVGAGAIVTRDVPPDTVVAGNPARVQCSLRQYLERHLASVRGARTFPYEDFRPERITPEQRQEMLRAVASGVAYFDHALDKPPAFPLEDYLRGR
ncbi:MAG: acyltransferase [Armatimonadota bacterium]|nr:acyltransferase [Armatimonadota bacterium]